VSQVLVSNNGDVRNIELYDLLSQERYSITGIVMDLLREELSYPESQLMVILKEELAKPESPLIPILEQAMNTIADKEIEKVLDSQSV